MSGQPILNNGENKMSIGIEPLGEMVLIELEQAAEKTASGLMLPEAAREKMNETQRLVDDLYWDYERLSRSGQETLDKLADEVKLWNK